MGYYEFTLSVPDESKDALLARMSDMGCLGSFERGGKVMAYFEDSHDIIKLRDAVKSFSDVLADSGLNGGFSFEYQYLSERDWNESWKKRFVPIDVGENLSILPPWEKSSHGRIALIIDPGMAFGTGHHETTRMCLSFIEKVARFSAKGSFLDVGTGTGILAIAASYLGYERVVAVDIDPLAVDASKRNVGLNGLSNIDIQEGTISNVRGSFDVIGANLMSEVLVKIAPELSSRLNDRGVSVLSGMLTGQEKEVIGAAEHAGLRVVEEVHDGRWVSLIVEKGSEEHG